MRGAHELMSVKLGGGAGSARALRLLLLLVLALVAIEYIVGFILQSPFRNFLYLQDYNTTPAALRNEEYSSWLTRVVSIPKPMQSSQNTTRNATNALESQFTNSSYNISSNVSEKPTINMTKLNNDTLSNYNESITPNLISRIIEIARNATTTQSSDIQNVTEKMCPVMPPDLGPIKVDTSEQDLDVVENKYAEVSWGGQYSPPNCLPRHKVAIIVPYRDRERHLPIFLNHMHPFLMKQQLEYGIFIVEQSGNNIYNKARLMNVGFEESMKLKSGGWQCFIFHDIDLLPLDGRNLYSCPRQPRHMASSIDKHFSSPYQKTFGGVTAMTKEQFVKVNGFSNKYWGWGGEDDDMFYRLKKRHYHVARYKMPIARYSSLPHKKAMPSPRRFELLHKLMKLPVTVEGLSTLEYELVNISQHHLYTHILVIIDERS